MHKSTTKYKDPFSTNMIESNRLHTNQVESKVKLAVKTSDQRAEFYISYG